MASKIHIPQSYFRRLRKWCSRQVRRFCCTSRVADDGDDYYKETQIKELPTSSLNGSQKPILDLRSFLPPPKGITAHTLGLLFVDVVPRPGNILSSLQDLRTQPRPPGNTYPRPASQLQRSRTRWKCPVSLNADTPSSDTSTKATFQKCGAHLDIQEPSAPRWHSAPLLPVQLFLLVCGLKLDGVLVMGGRLHDAILDTKGSWAPLSKHLAADEMLEEPEDSQSRWPVRCSRVCEMQGLLYPGSMDSNSLTSQLTWEWMPGQPLREFGDAVGRVFNAQDCQGAVITLNGRSSALLQNPAGGWMVVDSHAKDVLGATDVDGKSSLLRFPSPSHVVAYYSGMAVRPTQYSLKGFKVEPMSEGG